MNWGIDSAIVVVFLLITLVVGIISGRGITSIKQYSLGEGDFSTGTISATIIATWISGGIFSMAISETYTKGLYFIIPLLGDALVFFVIGLVLAPRMKNFLGKISIAELMGDLYGQHSRIITAIVGVLGCAGEIAIQFKVSSVLLQMLFGFSNIYAIGISAFIVIFYASFGGIKSVTFTDIIQFFTFGTIIPIITLIIWGTFDNPTIIFETLSNNPMFDYQQVFNPENPKFFVMVTLMLFFGLPHMYPVLFQRISMAQDTSQVTRSFVIAGGVCLFIEMIICLVGVLLYSKDPNLNPETLFAYILDNYSYVGFKGMVAASIMAMVMSTTDSYINSAAILFSHDLCRPLGIINIQNELSTSRFFAIFIGLLAFILALNSNTILELGMMVWSFYIPIVTVPILAAIFGFRTTSKSFSISTIMGLCTVVIWRCYFMDTGIDSVIPGMIANIIFFFGSHYSLRQPGGWIANKENDSKLTKKSWQIKQIFSNLTKINLHNFVLKNAPKNETIYSLFGFFTIVTVYSTMFSIDAVARDYYSQLISILYHSILIISSIFITYPIWPDKIKNRSFISWVWFISLFYVLVFAGMCQVIISNFGQFQLMTLLLSMVVLSILVRWQIALSFMIIGTISSVYFFKFYSGFNDIKIELWDLQFKIIYILLLVSSILIAFLKPKQEHLEETEAKVEDLESEVIELDHEVSGYREQVSNLSEKVSHYSERVEDQAKEIERLGSTAQKILNNVNHELRLPVGNVMNFAQMLGSGIDKMSVEEVKMISEEVYTNSTRLSTMILNMLDLAMLSAKKIELKKRTINFSELVEERVKTCRVIYLGDKKIDFRLTIEPEILIAVDPNYIRQVVDNIVINSINFSDEGLIEVNVTREDEFVKLTISDKGKGIPMAELYDIFTPFKMGSNSESKAQGRGVGLALCKAAIEAHGGSIKAESNGTQGAIFMVLLPRYKL
jgi:Na+/proline symporter/signal transduction histidine kinase